MRTAQGPGIGSKWEIEAVGRPLENIFISGSACAARVEVPSVAWIFFPLLSFTKWEWGDAKTLPKMARAMANNSAVWLVCSAPPAQIPGPCQSFGDNV